MSNTFDGVIREFPFIGIDRFNTTASVFLLTHSHSDHLAGITNQGFTGIVYCSNETKHLLALDPRFKRCLNLIQEVPYNVRTRLEGPHESKNAVYITLIDAYHCLGACMFLIEELHMSSGDETCRTCIQASDFDNGRVARAVLCTGDLRAEHWWCESIRLSPSLFPYTSGDRPLDCIYFDSTFAHRDEPYIEIPPNNQGIHTAISMLREFPKDDPDIAFEFCDTTLGFEQVWAFVLSYFGGSLKVANGLLQGKLRLVADHDRVNGQILKRAMERTSSSKKGPVFHGGAAATSSAIVVKIKQCINFNIRDYTGICFPVSLDHVPSPADLNLLHTTEMGNKLYEFLGRHWVLPAQGNELLPLEIKLLFSRHSSYSEVRSLLSMFKPRQVFPCSYSHNVWRNGFTMSRVFGEICSDAEFNYDTMMTCDHGLPLRQVLDRSVVTINRWNIEDCDREQKLIEEQVEKDTGMHEPALIKLRKVTRVPLRKTDKDKTFLQKRNKNFSLQKVVEGRRNVTYEKFVREQQMLYYKRHNLPQYKQDYHSPKYSREFTSALGGSSDYDTDSCSSSFDLLECCRKCALASGSMCEPSLPSFVQESREGLFWKVHKLSPRAKPVLQRSYVRSSFESFEESQSR